jgi:hypothetical protein
MKLSSPWVGKLILGVVLACFGVAAFELVRAFRAQAIALSPSWALLSALPAAAGYVGLALAFHRVLRAQAPARARLRVSAELYMRGMLARYLPGKVGIPAVRMAAAADLGVSTSYMAASAVLEALASMATAGVIAALLALGPWTAPRLNALATQPWAPWAICALALAVVLLAVIDVRRYPAAFLRLLRLEQQRGPLLPAAWIGACAFYWCMVAISSACVVQALGGASSAALLGAATGVIAPILGFLVAIAPGGLGVREAVAVALMTPELGPTGALAFGLASRLVLLITELALWLATRLWLAAA